MKNEVTAKLVFNEVPTFYQYAPYAIGMYVARQIKKRNKKSPLKDI